MGLRQVSEPRFWSQKQLSTMQVSQKCNLGKVGFSCLLFSYLNCLTSMQTGQLRPYYISPLIKIWTQTSKNQRCCWSTGRANFFIAPWKPAYWQFATFSFKTRNCNSGTKSVQPVACMTHAVMQRSLCKCFSWMSLLINSTFSNPFLWHSANKNYFLLLGRV